MKIYADSKRSIMADTYANKVQYYVNILNDITGHESGEVGSYRAYGGTGSMFLGYVINEGGGLKPMSDHMSAKQLLSVIDAIINVIQMEM